MKFKKLLAGVLSAAMIVTLMPSMAFASTTNSVSGVKTVSKNTVFTRTLELAVKDPSSWESNGGDNLTTQEVTLTLDNAKWYNEAKDDTSTKLTADMLNGNTAGTNAVYETTSNVNVVTPVTSTSTITIGGYTAALATTDDDLPKQLAKFVATYNADSANKNWTAAVALSKIEFTAKRAGAIASMGISVPTGTTQKTAGVNGSVVVADVLDSSGATKIGTNKLSVSVDYCSPTSVTLKIDQVGSKTATLVKDDIIKLTLLLKSTSTVGDITVDINSLSGEITAGSYVVATVVSGSTVATVPDSGTSDLELLTTRSNNQTASDLVIRESNAGVITGVSQTITLTLPKEISWNSAMAQSAGAPNATYYTGSMLTGVTDFTVVRGNSNRELKITFTPNGSSVNGVRRTFTISPKLDTTKDASEGDITVTIRSISGDFSAQSGLVIGTIGTTNNSVYVDEDDYDEGAIPALYSGMVYDYTDEDNLAIITIEEKADGDLTPEKWVDFTFDSKVQLAGQVEYSIDGATKISTNLDSDSTIKYDKNRNSFGWQVPALGDNTANKIKFYIPYTVEAGTEGDINCTVSGDAAGITETTVAVATVKPVITVSADTTEVRTGVQNQKINDIVITETAAGALSDSPNTDYNADVTDGTETSKFYQDDYTILSGGNFDTSKGILVDLPFALDEKPTAKVTAGDLELASTVTWSKNDAAKIYIEVKGASVKEASTITISGLIVSLDRYFAEGGYDIDVAGSSVVQNAGFAKGQVFTDAYTLTDAIKVVTPADATTIVDKIQAEFVIGATSYTNNGTAVEMDAAAYIDGNNRTMVPIRYIAEACGVTEDNISWNQATQTATINGANTVISIKMGSNIITTSTGNITMDTVAVNSNGRIYVPARFIANAFGANVTWNQDTKTVSVAK